jgi:tyrosine-protein kinase Etk/Wzc
MNVNSQENQRSAEEGISTGNSQSIFREAKEDEISNPCDLRKLSLGLRRHYLLILICGALFAGLGIYAAHYLASTYTAESILLFQEDKPKNIDENQPMIFFSLPTLIEMIKLPSHFESMKSLLGLELDPSDLSGMVSIPVPKDRSNFLRIQAKGSNPTLVVDVANTLAKIAVKDAQDFYRRQIMTQQESFISQFDKMHQKLSLQSQEIEEYKTKHQYYDMDPAVSSELTALEETKRKFLDASLLYNGLVVEYENLKNDTENLPAHVLDELAVTSAITPTETQITTISSQLIEAKVKYSPSNPKIKILEDQLKLLQRQAEQEANSKDSAAGVNVQKNRNLLKEDLNIQLMKMESKVRAAQKQMEELSADLARKEKQLTDLPKKQMEFSKLLQNKGITDEEFKNLNATLLTIELLLNNPPSDLQLYQLSTKASPLANSLPLGDLLLDLIPIIALLLGVSFGTCIALMMEYMDTRYCTTKQLEYSYTVPTLTQIPEMKFLNRKNGEQKTLFYVRKLAEQIDYLKPRSESSVLTITSSVDNEGKSCLAYYLARYWERLGERVILLDMDYNLNRFIDKSPLTQSGIADYLREKASLQELIIKGEPDHISVRDYDLGLKELIKSNRMRQLIEGLKGSYDRIIIDAPSVIKSNYATNLAALADINLFVIGSSKVKSKYIDASLKELESQGIRPEGIILNRVLPVYIDDVRILEERRRGLFAFVRDLFSSKDSLKTEDKIIDSSQVRDDD